MNQLRATRGLGVLAAVVVGTVGASGGSAQAQLRGTVQSQSFVGPVTGRTVQFNIYLPDGYSGSTERYPVIYHLHGIGGNQGGPQNTLVPQAFETALAAGTIGPVIVVFPNGYTDSWWADSVGGASGNQPAEIDVVQQLIPHVDATFRTIAQRTGRVIEGFSMGGFGATKFYTKYPDLFACCVEYDGALVTWADMLAFHPSQASAVFGNSEAAFNQYSPWNWASVNAPTLRTSTQIRMAAGALVQGNRRFRDYLIGLQIPVDYVETGCAHDIGCLLNSAGQASAAFIAARIDDTIGGGGCPVDIDGNGQVQPADVGAFVGRWFASVNQHTLAGDFDANGVVNPSDVASFVGAWFAAVASGDC